MAEDKFTYVICGNSDIGMTEDTDHLNKVMEQEWTRQAQQLQLKAAEFK